MRVSITINVDYDKASLPKNLEEDFLYHLENRIERAVGDDLLLSNDFVVDNYDLNLDIKNE